MINLCSCCKAVLLLRVPRKCWGIIELLVQITAARKHCIIQKLLEVMKIYEATMGFFLTSKTPSYQALVC